ncbi:MULTISPECIES: HAD family hydrolase [Actinomyces]|uniref:HAD family hydrolase n=1 Tax=Actinomyces TaxID=1654 RepID=UPI001E3675D0|nr:MULTISPECIES: HAD family hydrolase [Actinomyces]
MHTVIWDMGGTLVDTYPEVDRALAGVVWPGGVTSSHLAEVRELRTRSIAHAIDILSTRYEVDPVSFHRAYSDLKQRWHTRPAPLMDGARELMAAVHRAGGLNLVATHRDRTSAEALLAALHVEVDDLVSTSDGWARKPSPEMNLVLLRRHDLLATEVLAVGDRVIDVEAAEAADLPAALLVEAGTTLPDLRGTRPRVITDLRELLPLIG